jgi:hypothetical protein
MSMICDCGWEFSRIPESLVVERKRDPAHPDDPDAYLVRVKCPQCEAIITVYSNPRKVQGVGFGKARR